MDYLEFKEFLHRSLIEEDVKSWIRNALSEQQAQERGEPVKAELLKSTIHGYQEKIAILVTKNKQYAKELQEVELKSKSIQKELDAYQDLFGTQMEVYQLYSHLSENSKTALAGIFKNSDPDSLTAFGIQSGSLDALWEYAKIQIMKRQYQDLENMTGMISYFIHLQNKIKGSSACTVLETAPGELFDVEIHIRTPDSKPSGRIQHVLLKGYRNNHTNAVIKKSVVEL